MSLVFDLTVLEKLTSNAKQIQDDVLTEILKLNANTEYLRGFMHGSSDKELFKKNVPVVSYEDVKPYIDRVANGEPSDIISGKPITGFFLSSGTSSGKPKIFPVNDTCVEKFLFGYDLSYLIVAKHFDGVIQGKVVGFHFTQLQSTTPCGLPVAPGSTRLINSECFKNRPRNETSPDQVILCLDAKQSMYCQLLCALVERDSVVGLATTFASVLVQAIHFLENYWKELCSNIRYGHVSDWITDVSCRDVVSIVANPELADLIEHECGQKSWEGIISRLWPQAKFIEGTVTGLMAQYIPTLEFYSNKLPIISTKYVSSETFFGINVDPLSKPQHVSYTFLPNLSYFEFMQVDIDGGNMDEVVDLVDVKLGCYYEPLVTNHYGLHRCRVGDILQVTGFYNNTPQFKFTRRNNTVLSVYLEATTEEDLLKALSRATVVLESSNLMSTGFTCCVDISTNPGHYVFYLELKSKVANDSNNVDDKVLVECCCVMEEAFNDLYRMFRSKESIGALEIRVVQQGTFNSLMNFLISQQGSSISQYKTPICVNSTKALAVLEEKVLARFFSNKSPPI